MYCIIYCIMAVYEVMCLNQICAINSQGQSPRDLW